MSIEDIVEGLADRVVLCTTHHVTLETTAEHVMALTNRLNDRGYVKVTQVYRPKTSTWYVSAEYWAKTYQIAP